MQNQNTGKIPLAVIVAILVQTIGVVWWLSKLDLKVHIHDKFMERNQEIIYRLEERVKNLAEEVNELEANQRRK